MRAILADYHAQRAAFDEFCKPSSKHPILCFTGESGSGKTALLSDCMSRVPDDLLPITYNCKESLSISEFFSRSVYKVGSERLSNFISGVESLSKATINIQGIAQTGDQNKIEIALRADADKDRDSRKTTLTEAWFQDVRRLDRGLLIIVDTFEKSVSEMSSWFCGPFLARIPDTPQLRVLVAGQTPPDINNIEWGHCCQHHQLYGINDAKEWLPVVDAMERDIPFSDPMSWLGGVCYACKGNPSRIIAIIESLPRKKSV